MTAPQEVPLDVRPLFAADRELLLRLVRDLTPAEWSAETAAAPWRVREVVAHLVGGDVNRLSRTRDGHPGPPPGEDESLARFVHRINDEWVGAAARLSPAVLVSLLEATSPQVLAMWDAMDLGVTGEPVTWAGPGPAPVWLDCARDYTEYWVHRRQIAEATGRGTAGEDPALLATVLDTFVHAVPVALRRRGAGGSGGVLTLVARGAVDGRWSWPASADATVTVDADVLWRLCVRMATPAEARLAAAVTGDAAVAAAALELVSIIR
jgi:uncharacterized protein (TIGR03083 family)